MIRQFLPVTISRWIAVVLAMSCAGAVAGVPQADPMDWPYWRGPEMNGISREKGLVERWEPDGEHQLWKSTEAGSRSTPIVMNGKLYTLCRDQPETKFEGEKVLCLDAKTGEKLWENRFNVYLSDVPDTRVGWSSVVGDPSTGRVYALGVCGYFQCLDGETGETIWSHSLSEEYGLLSTYGGRTNFPIIHGDLVIISAIVIGWGDMAKPAHRFIAFDKRNGQPVWFNGTRLLPYDTTYSAPVIATIGNQDQLIFGSGDGGVHAFQPQTGVPIWHYEVSMRGINTTPVAVGNMVVCGHSEENVDGTEMGALFAIDATKTGAIPVGGEGELWRQKEWFVGKSAPLVVDGRVYACEDTGSLIIADLKTGEQIAQEKLGGPMRSSPIYADGKIYLFTENGRWWTFQPTEEGVETLYRARLRVGTVDGSPIVSHGRLYIPTSDALFCVGQEGVEPSADPLPESPSVPDASTDSTPAHLQVVPVEALLRPGTKGQRQQYQVRAYNSRGQWLRTLNPDEVEFAIEGAGEIDDNGMYTCPSDPMHAAVTVTAKAAGLTGTARIRLVPDFPWSFDFSSGQIPVTWVGARYRHIPIDFELLKSLEAESPLASQLYIYLMSSFVNSGRPTISYDDSTPDRNWSDFLRFLDLLETVQSLEAAQETLDPALGRLKDEQVLADWSWSMSEATPGNPAGPKITLNRGPRQIDGNGVMLKITTIPKGTRSQSWMGQAHFTDYTIQADVYGAEKDGKMPDIGLIGQRYTLDLMGASQQLQIRTWPPQLRMAETVPFQWEPETWYTMKLKATIEDGQAVLRGKVWKRDEAEPEQWQIQAMDVSPNLVGSPGLFGNAKDAEIYYDNIKVMSN